VLFHLTFAMFQPNDQVVLVPTINDKPTLADLLTIQRSLSIFYSYARETQFSNYFSDESRNITLTAPNNKAVIALPRKPHQGIKDNNLEEMPNISQAQYDFISKENVEKWVGAHIIPGYVTLGSEEETYDTLLPENPITFHLKKEISNPSWSDYTLGDDTKIIERMEASNGVLFIIDGTSLH